MYCEEYEGKTMESLSNKKRRSLCDQLMPRGIKGRPVLYGGVILILVCSNILESARVLPTNSCKYLFENERGSCTNSTSNSSSGAKHRRQAPAPITTQNRMRMNYKAQLTTTHGKLMRVVGGFHPKMFQFSSR